MDKNFITFESTMYSINMNHVISFHKRDDIFISFYLINRTNDWIVEFKDDEERDKVFEMLLTNFVKTIY